MFNHCDTTGERDRQTGRTVMLHSVGCNETAIKQYNYITSI